MTAKKTVRLTEQKLISLLRSLTVLMLPIVTTSVLSMLQLLTSATVPLPVWDVCCLVLTLSAWLLAIVVTRAGLLGAKMPKTALIISGCLLCSVLLYALAFAMEKEVLPFLAPFWAFGRLIGAPAAVSAGGMQVLLVVATEGTAAMLSGGLWLVVSFVAALPLRGKKKK